MDFNLIAETDGSQNDQIENLVKRAYDFGYECVAINTIVGSSNLTKNVSIPEPKYIDFNGKLGRTFRIMNRLTAVVKDSNHVHNFINSPITKKYDILAIQPASENVIEHVSSSVEVDIICLNLSTDMGFIVKRSQLNVAIRKGICFEISYTPCFKGETMRRSLISNSLTLVNNVKGKNIILSSGALKPLELRSPEDVSNMGMLFGLKANYAVEAVKRTGQLVLSHAGTRKNTGCGFVSLTGCLRIPKQQGWIVKMCKVPSLSSVSALNGGNKRKLDNSAENVLDDPKSKSLKLDNK